MDQEPELLTGEGHGVSKEEDRVDVLRPFLMKHDDRRKKKKKIHVCTGG